jgi:cysteine desulfurase family protein (TIGR01976 family)
MGYDVERVRARYPALRDGWAYLDGAAGAQVPQAVIDAEAAAYTAGIGTHGGMFTASHRSDESTHAARAGVADLVGAPSTEGVVLGPSATALTYRFAEGLARTWHEDDEVIVTRLDHDANVRPWVQAAARVGVTVRWADPELPEIELPAETVTDLITDRTKLVAITAASNVVGTRPDVRAVADAAHAVGALVYVDGVHTTPHVPVDVVELGADFYATSSYKWSGPHLAAVVGDPRLMETVHPDQLASSPSQVPLRFERGTSPIAQHAGMAAAVDHLAGLSGAGADRPRRERLLDALGAVAEHEADLLRRLLDGIGALDHVERLGSPARQAPTAWFRVRGMTPDQVAQRCAEARINVWSGHNDAWELAGLLGIRDTGSAVRASLSCYSTAEDVDRLLDVLAQLG